MTVHRDVPFAPELLLDIVVPDALPGPLPVIIWLHGGAWRLGDRTLAPDLQRYFADAGFAMVSIDYRLSQQAVFPAQLLDVRAAVRWVRQHAAEYGFDGANIGLWGSSAGGHLAALAGVLGDLETVAGELPGDEVRADLEPGASADADADADAYAVAPGASSAVQAVVDGYGPADLLAPDQAVPPTEGLLGGPVSEHRELAVEASPARQVRATAPPFLIMHGAADDLVPASQSEALFDALAAADVEATLYLIEGFGHGFFNPPLTNELAPEGAVGADAASASPAAGAGVADAPPAGPPIDAGHLELDPNAEASVRRHPRDDSRPFVPASHDLIADFFRTHLSR